LATFSNKLIKRGLNAGNIHCQLVQNILYLLLLSRNVKTKIYKRSSNCSCLLCGFDNWAVISREKLILKVFGIVVQRRIFRHKRK
jgi:hypothetical protein